MTSGRFFVCSLFSLEERVAQTFSVYQVNLSKTLSNYVQKQFVNEKRTSQYGDEDKRDLIIQIASKELGTREATGNNDGLRVEEYLRYTGLGKGYEGCAAFTSWVYGQAGFSALRNP